MRTKDEVARKLAAYDYEIDEDITHIYRLHARGTAESSAEEPVKLLIVSKDTVPAGILPLLFDPIPRRGISYPYVIVEVTPDEFRDIKSRRLKLPDGWRVGALLPRPEGNGKQ